MSQNIACASSAHIWIISQLKSMIWTLKQKRATIAIAFAIPTAVYQMQSTDEAQKPSNLYKVDIPARLVEKQKVKVIKTTIKILQKEGLIPLSFKKLPISNNLMKYAPLWLSSTFFHTNSCFYELTHSFTSVFYISLLKSAHNIFCSVLFS